MRARRVAGVAASAMLVVGCSGSDDPSSEAEESSGKDPAEVDQAVTVQYVPGSVAEYEVSLVQGQALVVEVVEESAPAEESGPYVVVGPAGPTGDGFADAVGTETTSVIAEAGAERSARISPPGFGVVASCAHIWDEGGATRVALIAPVNGSYGISVSTEDRKSTQDVRLATHYAEETAQAIGYNPALVLDVAGYSNVPGQEGFLDNFDDTNLTVIGEDAFSGGGTC